MDVTNDEHKELESARKEANKVRNTVPEMTTLAVKRRIRVLKAGAAPGPSGMRHIHIRAIAAAPKAFRANAAWIAAWTKGKHQEMKSWSAALIVPLDRDGTSETDRPHRSTSEARAGNTDGKKTPQATNPAKQKAKGRHNTSDNSR